MIFTEAFALEFILEMITDQLKLVDYCKSLSKEKRTDLLQIIDKLRIYFSTIEVGVIVELDRVLFYKFNDQFAMIFVPQANHFVFRVELV